MKRNYLALASFEEHFEREVRQKLRLELKVLDTIHLAFNNYMDSLPEGPSIGPNRDELKRVREVTSSASLRDYFQSELLNSISKLEDLSSFRTATGRNQVESSEVVAYVEQASMDFVEKYAIQLNEFHVSDLLFNPNDDYKMPVFVDKLPEVKTLFHQVRVQSDVMHDSPKSENGTVFVYSGLSGTSKKEDFKKFVAKELECTRDCHLLPTKNPTRLGILRECELDDPLRSQQMTELDQPNMVKLKFHDSGSESKLGGQMSASEN